MRPKNEDYYKLEKRITKVGRIKNKYTYHAFYDTPRNSPINRYRLWNKYRKKCKEDGKKAVTFKEYGYIIHNIDAKITEEIIKDPDGVIFPHFNLKLVFRILDKKRRLDIDLVAKSKKKVINSVFHWGIILNDSVKKRLAKEITNHLNYKSKHEPRRPELILDIFDDF